MSVYEHEPKFYVFIQFSKALSDNERQEITELLLEDGRDDYSMSEDEITVDSFEDEYEANAFEETFTEKFSNLIK